MTVAEIADRATRDPATLTVDEVAALGRWALLTDEFLRQIVRPLTVPAEGVQRAAAVLREQMHRGRA